MFQTCPFILAQTINFFNTVRGCVYLTGDHDDDKKDTITNEMFLFSSVPRE